MKTIRNNLILLICLICTVTLLCIGCSKDQKVSDEQTAEQTQEAQTTRAGTSAAEEVQDSAQETVPAGESAALETGITISSLKGAAFLEDASGESRGTQEGSSIGNGQVFVTEKDSAATISLDPDKSLYVDENTRVSFASEGKKLEMKVEEGQVLLDVRKKLGEDETLVLSGIALSGDIRGTIVYVVERPLPDDARATTLGVLEGTANVGFIDESGVRRTLPVPAGNKINLQYQQEDTSTNTIAVEERALTREDIAGFVAETVNNDAEMKKRVDDATNVLNGEVERQQADSWSADGDWSWNETVTLVAQSASKMYDGTPLTRPSDVLVYGLPNDFSIRVSAVGTQTDAGTGANNIGSYTILNPSGEDVTSHFPSIETVSGRLVVDPAPITIWTGSAEKVYDGTELTEPAAGVVGLSIGDSAFDNTIPEWRNSALEITSAPEQKVLYGVCGVVWVHGTNPLTGETRESQLYVGQRLTIMLSDEEGKGSIEFKTEKLAEEDLPEEVLRFYASKPEMLAQACADTGWDSAVIEERIAALPDSEGSGSEETLLYNNCVDVRINIDSDVTNYNERGLTDDEVTFVSPKVDESIIITATGSQMEAGNSLNTYEIDWGNANPSNYIMNEELGTLTVNPAPVTITTGSAEKVYDGTPLTNPEATITGLAAGESVTVTTTGTITEVGTVGNVYSIDWGRTDSSNYDVTSRLGELTIEPLNLEVRFNLEKGVTYNGSVWSPNSDDVVATYLNGPHAGETVSPAQMSGKVFQFTLFTGDTFDISVRGQGKDAGSYTLTTETSSLTDSIQITWAGTSFEILPVQLMVETASASKVYDGNALTAADVNVYVVGPGEETTLVSENGVYQLGDDTITFTAIGTITDEGETANTYSVDWGNASSSNYVITDKLGTLTVTKNPSTITLTAGSASKTYDGTALTSNEITAEGLPDGYSISGTCQGTQTDAGSHVNQIVEYRLFDETGKNITEFYNGVIFSNGTLTVTPAPLTITTLSDEKAYDGEPLTAGATISGLVNNETVTVTTTASVTEVNEEAPNTYNISWGTAKETNYTVTENIGTLKIVPLQIGVQWSLSEDLPYAGFTWTAGNGRARGEVQVTYLNGPHAGKAVDQYQPNEISLEEEEYMEEEDGAPFKFELFTGDIMSVTVSGERENAGTCDVKTMVVMDTENTARYVFSCGEASFEILPTKLTIVTDSAAKVYDGNSLTASGVKIYVGEGEDQFLFSENGQYEDTKVKITVTNNGSITEIGTDENTCDISWSEGANKGNYDISYEYGTLEVKAYEIYLKEGLIAIGDGYYMLLDAEKTEETCIRICNTNKDLSSDELVAMLVKELQDKGYIVPALS